MKPRGQRYFVHLLSNTLCIYQGGKGGRKRLFGLTGAQKGTKFTFSKQGFKDGFKEIKDKKEIAKFFERDKPRAKIVLPGNATQQKQET